MTPAAAPGPVPHIGFGHVWHTRLRPRQHRFSVPTFFLMLPMRTLRAQPQAAGVLALLAAQIFINIGMTTGLMPVTGMTLPLVSYGGSSLLINGMALGLLVNVGRHRPRSLAPTPFEFDEPD